MASKVTLNDGCQRLLPNGKMLPCVLEVLLHLQEC